MSSGYLSVSFENKFHHSCVPEENITWTKATVYKGANGPSVFFNFSFPLVVYTVHH